MDATQYKDYMNEADINFPLSSHPFLPIEQQGPALGNEHVRPSRQFESASFQYLSVSVKQNFS